MSITKTKIVVHHAGNGEAAKRATFEKIRAWHTQPNNPALPAKKRGRGWSKIGYHWVIEKSGKGCRGREDNEVGAHSRPGNRRGLGVNVCGNFNVQQPTAAQWQELVRICANWCVKFGIEPGPTTIVGHKDLQPMKKKGPNKCPGQNLYSKLPRLRREVAQRIAFSERAALHQWNRIA